MNQRQEFPPWKLIHFGGYRLPFNRKLGEGAKVKPKTHAGRAVCPFQRSNVPPPAVWQGTSLLQCSFPRPAIKQSSLPTTTTWLHESCNETCQNGDPGDNISALHQSSARPQVNNSESLVKMLHQPPLVVQSEVVRVRFKIHTSQNICGFANFL